MGALAICCAAREYDSAIAARAEYDACVRSHGAKHPDCEVLWQAYQTELERYEAAARRGWACDPMQEQCPPKR